MHSSFEMLNTGKVKNLIIAPDIAGAISGGDVFLCCYQIVPSQESTFSRLASSSSNHRVVTHFDSV